MPGPITHEMLDEEDDGELAISIGIHEGTVIIHFGTSVRWIGLGPELAIEIGEAIIKHAQELQQQRNEQVRDKH